MVMKGEGVVNDGVERGRTTRPQAECGSRSPSFLYSSLLLLLIYHTPRRAKWFLEVWRAGLSEVALSVLWIATPVGRARNYYHLCGLEQNRTEPIEQRHMLSDVGRLIPFVTSSQLLSCLVLHPLTILSSCVLFEYYHLFKLPGVYAYTSHNRLREHRLLMYLWIPRYPPPLRLSPGVEHFLHIFY